MDLSGHLHASDTSICRICGCVHVRMSYLPQTIYDQPGLFEVDCITTMNMYVDELLYIYQSSCKTQENVVDI